MKRTFQTSKDALGTSSRNVRVILFACIVVITVSSRVLSRGRLTGRVSTNILHTSTPVVYIKTVQRAI